LRYFVYLFEHLFANLMEETAPRIKSKFFIYTNKSLINIHAKVHLNLLLVSKLFYLKLQRNMAISLHKLL